MQTKPLVTLIMSMYNGESYLEKCLESIVSQSYSNIEVLLFDDGSIDRSGIIAEDFARKDSRIKVIHNRNLGCSAERNRGISLAQGEYIGIVDQDDYLHKDYVKYLIELILKTGVEIATTKYVKSFVGVPPKCEQLHPDRYSIWTGKDAANAMLMNNIIICPWNKLIKKEFLVKHNIKFQEQLFCGEGFAFSVEAFLATTRVAMGHEAIYFYRKDNLNSGTSIFSIAKYKSSLSAHDYMEKITPDKSEKQNNIFSFSRWRTTAFFFTLLNFCKEQKKYPVLYKEMREFSHKNARFALKVPTKKEEKLLALAFLINPDLASSFYNFRKRRKLRKTFNKAKEN